MNIITGDLIQMGQSGIFDVIVHGCNCFCTMDAGIARQIKEVFPAAYMADLNTEIGDRYKLGTFSSATVVGDNKFITVVNGYTQYDFVGKEPLVDYSALEKVFEKLKVEFSGSKIAYPRIGAGLAKGDWGVIADIIDSALEGEDHTLVNRFQ